MRNELFENKKPFARKCDGLFFIDNKKEYKMSKNKINNLIKEIEGTLNSCSAVDIEYHFIEVKDKMLEKLRELRAELGIWDK